MSPLRRVHTVAFTKSAREMAIGATQSPTMWVPGRPSQRSLSRGVNLEVISEGLSPRRLFLRLQQRIAENPTPKTY